MIRPSTSCLKFHENCSPYYQLQINIYLLLLANVRDLLKKLV